MRHALDRQAGEARRRGRPALLAFWIRTLASSLALGGLERLRAVGLGRSGLGATMQEIRIAARRLARTPGFTAATVLTLALGLGGTTAIHAVVDGVLIEPLPYPHSDRLLWIGHALEGVDIPRIGASPGIFVHYRDHAASLDGLAVYRSGRSTLVGDDGPDRLASGTVSHGFFGLMFEGAPELGRWIGASDDLPGAAPVAMIAHGLWQRRYGSDPRVLGRIERIDGQPTEIVGVLPPGFRFLDRAPEILLPTRIDESTVVLGGFGLTMVGRSAPGLGPDDVRRELAALIPSTRERFNPIAYDLIVGDGRLAPIVEPLQQALVGPMERTLWILSATVIFVLLIACANVANLFLVRAESRRREGWIRSALGAGRWPVARMFVVESLLLTTLGGVLALGLANIGVTLLVRHGPEALPRLESVGIDAGVAAMTLLTSTGAGLLLGLLAAFRPMPDELAGALGDGGRGATAGARSNRLRRGLVVAQVALALVLLVGTALLLQTFQRLGGVDPGFEAEGAIGFRIALSDVEYEDRVEAGRFQQQLVDRLAALPGVTDAGAVQCLPLTDCGAVNVVYVEGETPPEEQPTSAVYTLGATGGAFEALGIPLLEGRSFEARDIGGPSAAIVSRGLADRLWPGRSPLGERIHPDYPEDGEAPYTVVGVVADHYSGGLADGPTENVYLSLAGGYEYMTNPRNLSFVVRGSGGTAALAAAAREVVREANPGLPVVDVRPLTDLAEAERGATSFALVLLALAGTVAAALGVVGVYGMLAYMVGQRSTEIGVRIAIGAEPSSVTRLVAREALAVVSLGVLIGLGGAGLASRAMDSVLFGVAATDPVTYGGVAAVLTIVALAAAWIPARRAGRIDPVEALRAQP